MVKTHRAARVDAALPGSCMHHLGSDKFAA